MEAKIFNSIHNEDIKRASELFSNLPQDMRIIGKDKDTIWVNKFVLSLHSPYVCDLISQTNLISDSILLPDFSSFALNHLFNIINNGICKSSSNLSREQIDEIFECAEVLQIDVNPSNSRVDFIEAHNGKEAFEVQNNIDNSYKLSTEFREFKDDSEHDESVFSSSTRIKSELKDHLNIKKEVLEYIENENIKKEQDHIKQELKEETSDDTIRVDASNIFDMELCSEYVEFGDTSKELEQLQETADFGSNKTKQIHSLLETNLEQVQQSNTEETAMAMNLKNEPHLLQNIIDQTKQVKNRMLQPTLPENFSTQSTKSGYVSEYLTLNEINKEIIGGQSDLQNEREKQIEGKRKRNDFTEELENFEYMNNELSKKDYMQTRKKIKINDFHKTTPTKSNPTLKSKLEYDIIKGEKEYDSYKYKLDKFKINVVNGAFKDILEDHEVNETTTTTNTTLKEKLEDVIVKQEKDSDAYALKIFKINLVNETLQEILKGHGNKGENEENIEDKMVKSADIFHCQLCNFVDILLLIKRHYIIDHFKEDLLEYCNELEQKCLICLETFNKTSVIVQHLVVKHHQLNVILKEKRLEPLPTGSSSSKPLIHKNIDIGEKMAKRVENDDSLESVHQKMESNEFWSEENLIPTLKLNIESTSKNEENIFDTIQTNKSIQPSVENTIDVEEFLQQNALWLSPKGKNISKEARQTNIESVDVSDEEEYEDDKDSVHKKNVKNIWSMIKEHWEEKGNGIKENNNNFQCTICSKYFKNSMFLSIHNNLCV